MFCSCATSGDTAEAQYSPPKHESFRGSPLDTYGGIRNTSSFRTDKERHNRPGYWNSQIPRKYRYYTLQKLDTTSTKTIKTDKKK